MKDDMARDSATAIDRLAGMAAGLGFEIVDVAGFLDTVEEHGRSQRAALETLGQSADQVRHANAAASGVVNDLTASVSRTFDDVQGAARVLRSASENTRDVAEWVQQVGNRSDEVADTLTAVQMNNSQIAAISLQVTTLAINAKIEAARAGEAGRGFAVVAEAINDLSRQTKAAAEQISGNIETLTAWISGLGAEAHDIARSARDVLEQSTNTDTVLRRMEQSVGAARDDTGRISEHTTAVQQAMAALDPSVEGIRGAVQATSTGIEEAHHRIESLIDTSEAIVQSTAALGGTTEDAPFIAYVCDLSGSLSQMLDTALADGRISHAALFDRSYQPIAGTNPTQVLTGFTQLFEEILPPLSEPALDFDPRVVFCAAVDRNGYLPTHNRKFSQPQGSDPVWNTAHCRNRRIFDDRVGLKAGRSTDPFLLQVYRRDMGGGNFVMMKDLSAPIFAAGQHWGGLRLAYTFG